MTRAVAAASLLTGLLFASSALAADGCEGLRELRIVNGRIHTMDRRNTVASSVIIRDGKFVQVGGKMGRAGACVETIDVHGKTVIPGLIDNHNHFILLAARPGHDVRFETATSIADIQSALRARAAALPRTSWITGMGGWTPRQLAEGRMPSRAELDAAVPDHPALIYLSFTGPAVTNSKGRDALIARGVAVGEDGTLAAGPPSVAAKDAIQALQTPADSEQGAVEAMAYAASLGLTTNVDMGEFIEPGTPDVQDSVTQKGLGSGDPFHMYDPFLKLQREGRLSTRLRIFFLSMDRGPDFPMTRQRALNAFGLFGDDMMRVSGIGEFATSWPIFSKVEAPANFEPALQFIASRGWTYQQHSLSLAEDKLIADAFEAVNRQTSIGPLHWSIAHVPGIDRATVERFKAIGAGIAVHPIQYLGSDRFKGPPLRMILESGVHVGAGSDSAQVATLNPWNMIYYMVTGRDAAGNAVNVDQTITRDQALRLYTAENGWFLHEEDKLGSIEPGKLADIVVLSGDYFDPVSTPDADLRKLHSVLTVVGGKVVYKAR